MAIEKRLIDANAFFDKLKKLAELMKQGKIGEIDLNLLIASTPTVDAVEVVRCLKCRYRSQYSDDNGMYKCGGLQTEDGDVAAMVKPDFFCAYGERKDNG